MAAGTEGSVYMLHSGFSYELNWPESHVTKHYPQIINNNLRMLNFWQTCWNTKVLQVKAATSTTVNNSKENTRGRNPPDSLIKSLNFVSCWVRRSFPNFMKDCSWHIFNHLGLLVNSACYSLVLGHAAAPSASLVPASMYLIHSRYEQQL